MNEMNEQGFLNLCPALNEYSSERSKNSLDEIKKTQSLETNLPKSRKSRKNELFDSEKMNILTRRSKLGPQN